MSNSDLTSILLVLLLLVGLAQLLGYLFTRLRQPKVVGEILAGVVLGPALLGKIRFGSVTFMDLTSRHETVLTFVYWLGLLLLMFLSGAEIRDLFTRVCANVCALVSPALANAASQTKQDQPLVFADDSHGGVNDRGEKNDDQNCDGNR
jgi:predicted Kef-type K+ transport protein